MNLKQRTEKQSRTLSNIKEYYNQVAQKQRLKKMKRRKRKTHIWRNNLRNSKKFLIRKGQEYNGATSYT